MRIAMRAPDRSACEGGCRLVRSLRPPPIRVPRFRSSSYVAAASDTNFGNKGGTRNFMTLVPLFDLKFLSEFAADGVGTSNRRHERRRATLAGNHCGAQQERPRAFPVRRRLAQLVKIAPAHLRIACFKTFLVGDRLLLHELDRDGAPLQIVEVKEPLRRTFEQHLGKL